MQTRAVDSTVFQRMLFSVMVTLTASAVPDDVIKALATRRIFFGHQSVGGNIVEGIEALSQGKLTVKEGRAPIASDGPWVLHTLIGKNEEPQTKIADFEATMEQLGRHVDVAFFKFCYVDFDAQTDAEKLFSQYQATMQRLEAKYPTVKFVHVTVPLTVVQQGLKAWVKKTILGQAPWGARENAVRERFNALLRQAVPGPKLFDLAALESTRADGSGVTFELDGKMFPALVPEYSDDGQHLNSAGRLRVGEALLRFLAKLP